MPPLVHSVESHPLTHVWVDLLLVGKVPPSDT